MEEGVLLAAQECSFSHPLGSSNQLIKITHTVKKTPLGHKDGVSPLGHKDGVSVATNALSLVVEITARS